MHELRVSKCKLRGKNLIFSTPFCRLRYKGTYMRDSYTLEEYSILNNAVIGMVPLNDISEVSYLTALQVYFLL